jgi:hypothetical protein
VSLPAFVGWAVVACTAVSACGPRLSSNENDVETAGDASSLDIGSVDANASCLAAGSAQLNVMLDTAPGLQIDRSEVWIAAMCIAGSEERPVRIVRADPTGHATIIAGLGAGPYVVRVSALVVPGIASTRIDLRAGATALTSLTLAPGDPPLALLRAMPVVTDGGFDASARDAGLDAAVADAMAPPSDSGPSANVLTTRIVRAGTTDVLGTAEALLEPRDRTSFDVTVRVTAAADCAACTRLDLAGLELRSTHMGDPLGFAVSTFDYDAIAPGYTATSVRRTLQGTLDDPNLGFALAVFGGPSDPDAGLRDR